MPGENMKDPAAEQDGDGCLLEGSAPVETEGSCDAPTLKRTDDAALKRVRLAAMVANLTNLAFGYDVGCMSGALLYLRRPAELALSEWQAEVVASLFNVAAAFGSFTVAGPLSDRCGRRVALLTSAVLLLAGFLLQAAAPGFVVLAAGRALAGSGSGIAWVAALTLLAELAPTSERGRLTAMADLAINVGIGVRTAGSRLGSHPDPVIPGRSALCSAMRRLYCASPSSRATARDGDP